MQRPTAMSDGHRIHKEIQGREDHLASPNFVADYKWTINGRGHVLSNADDIEERFPMSIIGIVSTDRPNIDTSGDYNPQYNNLRDSKFRFTLEKPHMDGPLAADFDIAVDKLWTILDEASKIQKKDYVIETTNGQRRLRFSSKMFERRSVPYNGDEQDETRRWPIAPQYQHALKEVVPLFSIRRMAVYDTDNTLVDPALVHPLLVGALVEVTFTVYHMAFKSGERFVENFNGIFEQVRILRRPPPKHLSPFRQNLSAGPFIPRRRRPPSSQHQPTVMASVSPSANDMNGDTGNQGATSTKASTSTEQSANPKGPRILVDISSQPSPSPSPPPSTQAIASSVDQMLETTRTQEETQASIMSQDSHLAGGDQGLTMLEAPRMHDDLISDGSLTPLSDTGCNAGIVVSGVDTSSRGKRKALDSPDEDSSGTRGRKSVRRA